MKKNSNNRVLITQNSLRKINGSEVVTYELAKFLKSNGYEVDVYTHVYDYPVKKYFEEADINVTTNSLNLKSYYDIIWVHHQVLPRAVIESIATHPTRVFFFHMSGVLPLESPYIHNLEERLASKSVFVSEEALNLIRVRIPSTQQTALFQNPAPLAYAEYQPEAHELMSPRKVLVVSNHAPKEIIELTKISQDYTSIHFDYRGESSQETTELIDIETLRQYDLVITIGKTVQYCLCANIPVYVYDHLGGPGYLNKHNFKKAEYHNFSGRGFKQKDSEVIFNDILSGYAEAAKYQTKQRKVYLEKFSIDNILIPLIESSEPVRVTLPQEYLRYAEITHDIMRQYIILYQNTDTKLISARDELRSLKHINNNLIDVTSRKERDFYNFSQRKIIRIADKLDYILRRLLK